VLRVSEQASRRWRAGSSRSGSDRRDRADVFKLFARAIIEDAGGIDFQAVIVRRGADDFDPGR
jgi:hypothetical protein